MGHQTTKQLHNFLNGSGCNVCSRTERKTIDYVRAKAEECGYQLLSNEYENIRTKITLKCKNEHIWTPTASDLFQRKTHCRECETSLSENECRKIFEDIFKKPFPTKRPDFLRNPRTGRNLELDGFCEELNIAFEYDGEYHYNNYFGQEFLEKIQKNDKIKDDLCVKNKTLLIRIPFSVKDKKEHILSSLKHHNIEIVG